MRLRNLSQAVQDFEIEGVGVFQCQCTAFACPCQTNGAPTHGTCYAADVAHIKTGHYGKVKLDGLSIAMVGDLVDAKPDRPFSPVHPFRMGRHAFAISDLAGNEPQIVSSNYPLRLPRSVHNYMGFARAGTVPAGHNAMIIFI